MKIVTEIIELWGRGVHPAQREVLEWSEDWPIPREGEVVSLRSQSLDQALAYYVRRVVWHPDGEPRGSREPLVRLLVSVDQGHWSQEKLAAMLSEETDKAGDDGSDG